MSAELTLASVGAGALSEGIKFLYGQAGEVLRRWRERRATPPIEEGLKEGPLTVETPLVIAGELGPIAVDFEAVARLEGELKTLRAALLEYAEGESVDAADEDLLRTVDGLRRVLEAVYGQRITFKGEKRLPSGPMAEGEIDIDAVRGYAAGLRVKRMSSGHARGKARARTAEEGGEVIGLEVEELG